MNFPRPHLKNWRAGLRTKLCRVPEPFFVSPHISAWRLHETVLSRAPWALSRQWSWENPLLSLHMCHAFPFISASLFHLLVSQSFAFSSWVELSSSVQSLLCSCQDQPCAVCCPGQSRTAEGADRPVLRGGPEGNLRNSRDDMVKTISHPAGGRLQNHFYSVSSSASQHCLE